MEKVKVKCYISYANVYPGVYNHPVYCMIYEGWSNFRLYTCIGCGELFVIDLENPNRREIKESCPACATDLSKSLKPYPEFIKLADGKIGSFTPEPIIPTDNEIQIIEFFKP